MNATTAAKATNAYAKVSFESSVAGADPHKLIALLFQGALLAIANAKNGILRKDIPAKGKAISHAILIIDEGLNASLDKNVGGQLAMDLEALYSYMCVRLLNANVKNDIEALDEVSRLLTEIKDAWDGIRQTCVPQISVSAQMPTTMTKQPSLVYGRA